MSAPLVTPSRDALADALGAMPEAYNVTDHTDEQTTMIAAPVEMIADALIAAGAVIDAATLADDETIRAVAYRFAEGEATYAASTVRYVLSALVDVLAERGEQHG